MATPARYVEAMRAAGFTDISTTSRNGWYCLQALEELARLKGELGARAAALVGQEFVDLNIGIWSRMTPFWTRASIAPRIFSRANPEPPLRRTRDCPRFPPGFGHDFDQDFWFDARARRRLGTGVFG